MRPFHIVLGDVNYPSAAGNMNEGTNTGLSFANVRENLQAIATALSAESDDWRAEVQGHRLALIPDFGDAGAGLNAAFTSTNPVLTAAGKF